MDFGSLSGRSSKSRDGSIKRKTFLGAFRKSSQPPSSFNPPPLPPPNASLPPLPASASSANPSFSLSSRGHPGKASSSRGASHPPGQPQGLPFDDEPTSPSAESYSSHGQSVGHTTLQSQSAWPGISGQGTSEWGAKGSMAPSVTASSWKGREGSLRGSSMGHGQYAESLASSSTAVFPSASIGRSGSTMGYGTATSSVTGERPRERAPSGKYSLTDANRRELADVKETKDRDKDSGGTQKGAVVRRPEDLVKVVKDRMFSWSYMMTWYQGDSHWFNTVKIPRSAAEAFLGPKQLEARARNYYVLGMSLGMLFDISGAPEFLRALTRVLEEWEIMAEGGGSKVKNLFKGQRGSRKTSGSGEYHSLIHHDGDSYLYNASLPFGLDFFQVHATLCSIIRDIYKKILKSFLPSKPPSSAWAAPLPDPLSLVHPSTIIHSAPLDTPFSPPLPKSSSHAPSASISSSAHGHAQGRPPSVRSPSTKSTSSFSSNPHQPTAQVHSRPGMQRKGSETGSQVRGAYTSMGEAGGSMQSGQGVMMPDLHRHATAGQEGEYDAFQMFILGELPHDRTLVGDGQGMGKEVVELFTRADGKLRKHFSVLLRETDALARRVLDNEIHSVLDSFTPGSQPLQFDFGAALSLTAGNGYAVQHQQRMGPGAVA